MKTLKIELVILLLLFFCVACIGEHQIKKNNDKLSISDTIYQSKLHIPESTFDFGKVEKSKNKLMHSFEIMNIGKSPLVIHDVVVSCNCISVVFDKQPIIPKAKGKIVVYLDTQKQRGKVSKKIFIKSNAENSLELLYIRAMINY